MSNYESVLTQHLYNFRPGTSGASTSVANAIGKSPPDPIVTISKVSGQSGPNATSTGTAGSQQVKPTMPPTRYLIAYLVRSLFMSGFILGYLKHFRHTLAIQYEGLASKLR